MSALAAVQARAMRWRPARRVPLVRQMERTDCAAACLAMLLRYHGRAVTLGEVRGVCGSGRDGTSAAAIARAARHFGCTPSAVRLARTTGAALHGVKLPAIAYVDDGHFVVIERVERRGVRVLDPDAGREFWSDADFARRCSGVVLCCMPAGDWIPQRVARPTVAHYVANLRRCAAAVIWVAACTALLELIALIFPAATQVVVDHVIQPGRDEWLWPIGAGLAAAGVAYVALIFARDRVIHLLHITLDLALMSEFVAHLLRVPLRTLQQRSTGDLMQRVSANVELRDLSTRLVTALLDSALALSYSVLMLAYHWRIGLMVLSLHAFRLAMSQLGRRGQREAIAHELAARGREDAAALEALSAPEMVRAFKLQAMLAERCRAAVHGRANAALVRTALVQQQGRLMQLFDGLAHAALLFACGTAVVAEQLTLGEFAGLLALHALLGRPLQAMVAMAVELTLLRATLERLDDVLAVPSERSGGARLPALRGEIELRNVSFRYDVHARDVVRDVNLHVRPGEKVAIVGRSGAGKSTLAHLVLGLVQSTCGTVLIDGRPLDCLDLDALRRQIGAVLQDAFVFDDTVRANLNLADDDPPLTALRAAARNACLDEVIDALPQGYQTRLGPGGMRLSGGQRQRIAIARALLRQPALLVLDEATSHLDAHTEQQVQRALENLRCTQLVIAHRLATVRNADRVVVLENGSIVQQGTYEELAATEGVFRTLLHGGRDLC
jgi:ABC-type bacteriocin/lantibiotic exporter with double-glycine peptidase domain